MKCLCSGPCVCYEARIDKLRRDKSALASRALELELEVKRLREAMYGMNCDFTPAGRYPEDGKLHDSRICRKCKAISTPPPALAEAHGLLREAAEETVSASDTMSERLAVAHLRIALGDIKRLERGE